MANIDSHLSPDSPVFIMERRVKREAGLHITNSTPPRGLNNNINSSNSNNSGSVATPPSKTRGRLAAPSAISTSVAETSRRGQRSGAPTVDTRLAAQAAQHLQAPSETGDEVVFMQVRPAPVKEESRDGQTDTQVPDASDIDKNLKDIGQHLKSFNDTLGSLQSLGIHHDTPLPELILVGDQSSGKSSLMSAISQIILPRSDGACTRCPIHIRLSSDTTWRCRVSLQQDYAYRPPNNEPITEANVTEHNPFPPWVKQSREVKEFKMVYSKTDPIDEVVRWAQIAILNHCQTFNQYVPKDWELRTTTEKLPEYEAQRLTEAERMTEAKFSPNTVAVEVKGPGLPDLSFYDMPGVFRNAKHEEDQFLVKVVENLVRDYISHEKAIILWAVPMNHDPETSSTYALIRQLRAQHRTIGVMTKADLLPNGGHQQWLAMLAGQQHQVGHGYFITSRAPPKIQKDDGHELQRRDRQSLRDEHAAEEAFFNRATGSWPKEFQRFDERCGIDQLVKFLAQSLAQEFARSLPELSRKLHEKLNRAKEQLSRLPDMPLNPEHEVRVSLMKFTRDFQNRLNSKAFLSSWGKIAETFKTRVIDLKPKYRVMPNDYRPDSIATNLGANDRDSLFNGNNISSASVKRDRPVFDLTGDGGVPSPSARRRRGENGGSIKVEDANGSFIGTPFVPPSNPGRISSRTLDQVRNLIQSEREAGKPGEVPYGVIEKLCVEAVVTWEVPLKTFLDHTMTELRRELEASLNESFKKLRKRQVCREAKRLMMDWLQQHKKRIFQYLERNYKMETRQVYTTDDESFQRHRLQESQTLRRTRHFYRWKAYNGDTTAEKLQEWDKMTAEDRRNEEQRMHKEEAKLGDDEYSAELDVAARVRGYYLTAAMRFIDVTAMHITSGLFPDLVSDVEMHLEKEMGLFGGGANEAGLFVRLMEEETSSAEQRVQLKAQVARYERALGEIKDLNENVTQATTASTQSTEGQDFAMAEADVEYEHDGV